MFYEITKVQADSIGIFEYDKNRYIDPYVREQINGTYLVSNVMVDFLVENELIKKVDWKLQKTIIEPDDKNKISLQ